MKKLILTSLLGLFCEYSAANSIARSVGIYHWGESRAASMSEGIDVAARLGVHIVRISISPRYYIDYHQGSSCYPQFSLLRAAQEPDIQKALDNEKIEVLIITAYDGISFGDCINHRYLTPSFYTEQNTSVMIQEYSDFTFYLYQRYHHTHKKFIISNWEADNDIYCGAAFAYAMDPAFRSSCNAAYRSAYGGNDSPEESLDGLNRWFHVRQQGIANGRNRAAALGLGGMRVYFAPEFSLVHALHDSGFKSVLYDVLPHVVFDYASYSAYESINSTEPGKRLTADLDTIEAITGSDAIILGEIGFSRSKWGEKESLMRTDEIIETALGWGVRYIIQWNLYDQDPLNRYGIFDENAQLTALGVYYSEKLKTDTYKCAE